MGVPDLDNKVCEFMSQYNQIENFYIWENYFESNYAHPRFGTT